MQKIKIFSYIISSYSLYEIVCDAMIYISPFNHCDSKKEGTVCKTWHTCTVWNWFLGEVYSFCEYTFF